MTNAFVAYDDKTKKDSVTLEGASGTQIHNVKAGTADQDAVNLKQLKDAGLKTDSSGQSRRTRSSRTTTRRRRIR